MNMTTEDLIVELSGFADGTLEIKTVLRWWEITYRRDRRQVTHTQSGSLKDLLVSALEQAKAE